MLLTLPFVTQGYNLLLHIRSAAAAAQCCCGALPYCLLLHRTLFPASAVAAIAFLLW